MRNARRITLLGILLLCTGFFLPQVRGCKEDVVPVMWTVDSSGCFLVQWGLPFVFAFAAVIFLGLRRLARSEKAAKWIRRAACVFCVLILAYAGALEALLSVDLAPLVVDDVWGAVAGASLLVVAAGVVLILILAPTTTKIPASFFCCGVSALVYFLYMGSCCERRYGLWISVSGCLLTAVGSAIELLRAIRGAPPPAAGREGASGS